MELMISEYEAPAVECELSTEELEREIHYAGDFSGPIFV